MEFIRNHPFQSLAMFIGIIAVIQGPCASILRKVTGKPEKETAQQTVMVSAHRKSFLGRVGTFLTGHFLLSAISGALGFPIVASLTCIVLAIPLWLMGAKVELPEFVTEWGRTTWARMTHSLEDKKEKARAIFHEKEEQAKKAAHEAVEKARESREKAAEAMAEKMREAQRVAERIKEVERHAAEKVKAVEEAAAARVRDAKDLADKAASLTKVASIVGGYRRAVLPGRASPEQVELDKEREENRVIEAKWRSYRASEPLSRMTLEVYAAAFKEPSISGQIWSEEAAYVRRMKWRRWNAGLR